MCIRQTSAQENHRAKRQANAPAHNNIHIHHRALLQHNDGDSVPEVNAVVYNTMMQYATALHSLTDSGNF